MKIRLMEAKLFHVNRRRHGWTDRQTWRSDSRFSQFYECAL